MRRRIVLLLATITMALAMSNGTAMALVVSDGLSIPPDFPGMVNNCTYRYTSICLPTGDVTLHADNTSGVCTWTYNIAWGDGQSSSFVSRPGITESASHKYINPGIYTIDVTIPAGTSSDPSTSCGSLNQRYVVEVPNYRPDTFINTPPAPSPGSTVNSRDVTFTYASNRDYVTFECSLDGSDFSDCPSQGQTYSDLSDGQHQFEVRARDAGNNEDLSPATRTWTIDATAPTTPAITGPADNSFDTDGSVTLSGTAEPDSIVKVFDGTTSKGTTPPVDSSGSWSMTLSAVGEGAHTYTATATDAAGNTSGSGGPITVKVDTTKPTVIGTTPLNRATNVARGTNLTATFSEKMSTVNMTTFKLFKVNADGTQTQITDVVVSLSSDGLTAKLNPFGTTTTTVLARNTKYKGVLTTGTKDLAGNSLAQQKSWTFTTKP